MNEKQYTMGSRAGQIANPAPKNKINKQTAQEKTQYGSDFTGYTYTNGQTGQQIQFTSQAADWMRRAYLSQFDSYYAKDAADQANKASGAMPRSFVQSYTNSEADKKLYEMGLPSSKWLGKYLGDYAAWRGDGKVVDLDADPVAKAYVQDQWKKSWKYSGSLEDMRRQQEGRMPEALEEKYFAKGGKQFGLTKSFASQYYLEHGLPDADELGGFLASYSEWAHTKSRIGDLYAEVSRRALTAEVQEGVRDDDSEYSVRTTKKLPTLPNGKEYDPNELEEWSVNGAYGTAPAHHEYDYNTETVKGSDYLTKIFYDVLSEEKWADVRPYLKTPPKLPKDVKEEDYATYADYQAALIKAQDAAVATKKGEPDPDDPYALIVSADDWRKFYGADTIGWHATVSAMEAAQVFGLSEAEAEAAGVKGKSVKDAIGALDTKRAAQAAEEERKRYEEARGDRDAIRSILESTDESVSAEKAIRGFAENGYKAKDLKAVKNVLISLRPGDKEWRTEVLSAYDKILEELNRTPEEPAEKAPSVAASPSRMAAEPGVSPGEQRVRSLGDFNPDGEFSQFLGEDGKLQDVPNAVLYTFGHTDGNLTAKARAAAEMMKANGISAEDAVFNMLSTSPTYQYPLETADGQTGIDVIAEVYGTTAEAITAAPDSELRVAQSRNGSIDGFIASIHACIDGGDAEQAFEYALSLDENPGSYESMRGAIEYLIRNGVPKDTAIRAVGKRKVKNANGLLVSVSDLAESMYDAYSGDSSLIDEWSDTEKALGMARAEDIARSTFYDAIGNTPRITQSRADEWLGRFLNEDGSITDPQALVRDVFMQTSGDTYEKLIEAASVLKAAGIDESRAAMWMRESFKGRDDVDRSSIDSITAIAYGTSGTFSVEEWARKNLPDVDPVAKKIALKQNPVMVGELDMMAPAVGFGAEGVQAYIDHFAGQNIPDSVIERVVGEYIRREYDDGRLSQSEYMQAYSALLDGMTARHGDMFEKVIDIYREQGASVAGINPFEFDNGLRRASMDRYIEPEVGARDYFIWGGGGLAVLDAEDQRKFAALPKEKQEEFLTRAWDEGMTDEMRAAYIADFNDTLAVNPEVHKSIGQSITTYMAGGWAAKLLTGFLSAGVSFLDMATFGLGNKDGEDWEITKWARNLASMASSVDRLNPEQGKAAQNVSIGMEVIDQFSRMYVQHALGAWLGDSINWAYKDVSGGKGIAKALAWAANKAHTVLDGGRAVPFILDAAGGYYTEARENGEDIATSTIHGWVMGILEGVTEALATDEWTSAGLGGKGLAKAIASDSKLFTKTGIQGVMFLNNLLCSYLSENIEERISYFGGWVMKGLTWEGGFDEHKFSWEEFNQDGQMGGLIGLIGALSHAPFNSVYNSVYDFVIDNPDYNLSTIADMYLHDKIVGTLSDSAVEAYRSRGMSILSTEDFISTQHQISQSSVNAQKAKDKYQQTLEAEQGKLDAAKTIAREKQAALAALLDSPQQGSTEWAAEVERATKAANAALTDLNEAQAKYNANTEAARETMEATVMEMTRAAAKAQDAINAHSVYLHDLYTGEIANLRPYSRFSRNGRAAQAIREATDARLNELYGETIVRAEFDSIDSAAEDFVGAKETEAQKDRANLEWSDGMKEANAIITAAKAGAIDQYLKGREGIREMGRTLYQQSLSNPDTVGKTDEQWGYDNAKALLAYGAETKAGNPNADRNFELRKQIADENAARRLNLGGGTAATPQVNAAQDTSGNVARQATIAEQAAVPETETSAQTPAQPQGQEIPVQTSAGAQAVPVPVASTPARESAAAEPKPASETEKAEPKKATAKERTQPEGAKKPAPKYRQATDDEKATVKDFCDRVGRTVVFESMTRLKDGSMPAGYVDANGVIHINTNVNENVMGADPTSPDFFKSAIGTVLVHELTHTLENSSVYDRLQRAIIGTFSADGKVITEGMLTTTNEFSIGGLQDWYQDMQSMLTKIYQKRANETDEQYADRIAVAARREMVAYTIQRKLNTQEFANRIAAADKRISARIADWARHMLSLYRARGNKPDARTARALENVQYLYTKALLDVGGKASDGMRDFADNRFTIGSMAGLNRLRQMGENAAEEYGEDINPVTTFTTKIAPAKPWDNKGNKLAPRETTIAVWSDALAGLERDAFDKLKDLSHQLDGSRALPQYKIDAIATTNAIPLSEILSHDTIFAIYGDLGLNDVKIAPTIGKGGAYAKGDRASFDPNTNTILFNSQVLTDPLLSKAQREEQLKNDILHEVQHAIQVIEGVYTGTDPNTAAMYILGNVVFNVRRAEGFKELDSKQRRDANFAALAYLVYGKDMQAYEEAKANGFKDFGRKFREFAYATYQHSIGEREARFTEANTDLEGEELAEKAQAIYSDEAQFDVEGTPFRRQTGADGRTIPAGTLNAANIAKLYEMAGNAGHVDIYAPDDIKPGDQALTKLMKLLGADAENLDKLENNTDTFKIGKNTPLLFQPIGMFADETNIPEVEKEPANGKRYALDEIDIEKYMQNNSRAAFLKSMDDLYFDARAKGDTKMMRDVLEQCALAARPDIYKDENGMPITLHHGTRHFGFTIYDPSRSLYSHQGMYLSNSVLTSGSYAGHQNNVRKISDSAANDPNVVFMRKEDPYEPSEKALELLSKDNGGAQVRVFSQELKDEILRTRKEFIDNRSGTMAAVLDAFHGWDEYSAGLLTDEQRAMIPKDILGKMENIARDYSEPDYITPGEAWTTAKDINAVKDWLEDNRRSLDEDVANLVDTFIPDSKDWWELSDYTDLNVLDIVDVDPDDGDVSAKLVIGDYANKMPIVISAKGAIEGYIQRHGSKGTYDYGIYEGFAYLGDNPFVFDAERSEWNSIYFPPVGQEISTDEIAQWAKDNGHTSVIIKHVDDGYGGADADDIILFNSDQFKSIDLETFGDDGEIIPPSQRFTSDEDFRYALGDASVEEYMNAGRGAHVVSERTDLYGNMRFLIPSYDDLLQRYGAQEQGMTPRARNIKVPTQTSDDTKISKLYRSFMESPVLEDQFVEQAKAAVHDFDYTPMSNDELVEEARQSIADMGGLTVAAERVRAAAESGNVSALNNAIALQLVHEASLRGDAATMIDIMSVMSVAATESGRAVNAWKLLKRQMGGVGAASYWARVVNRVNEQYQKYIDRGRMKALDLNSPELQPLVQNLINARGRFEVEEAETALASRIGELLPLSFSEKIRNWRYFAMLAHIPTHERNMVGNTLMYGMRGLKNAVATGIERAVRLNTAERTHGFGGRNRGAFRDIARQSFDDNKREITGESRFSIEQMLNIRKRASDIKPLNWLMKKNTELLEKEDEWFLKFSYVDAFSEFCGAQGYDPTRMTREEYRLAHEHAMNEAQRATFHDPNRISTWLKTAPGAMKFFVDAVMPFTKTPVNIARRGIEYSPLGLIRGAYQAAEYLANRNKKGGAKHTAAGAIDLISSGLVGSALAALGYWLASAKFLRGLGRDEDDKANTFLTATGDQDYSLKLEIGGIPISAALSSFAPSMMPLFMGVAWYELSEATGEKDAFGVVLDAMSGITDPMTEMSFLSSLNDAIKSYNQEGLGGAVGTVITNAAKSYVGQFNPTAVKKLADVTDADNAARRTSGDRTSPLGTNTDQFLRSLAKGVPVLSSKVLEPAIDVHGDVVTRDWFGEWALNFANSYLLPSKITMRDRDSTDRELIRLYESTGSTSILPAVPSGTHKLTANHQTYTMNSQEETEYRAAMGKACYAAIRAIMADDSYDRMDDADRADAIEDAIADAKKQVNNEFKERFGLLTPKKKKGK